MAIEYVRRSTGLPPNCTSKNKANPIFVESTTDELSFGTGTSGSTTKAVVTKDQTQTLTGKTLTSPTVTTPVIHGKFESVAAAGTTVADAGAVTSSSGAFILGTGGNGTKGIVLPTGAAGDVFFIKNDDAANGILKVYAASGGKINGGSANAALSFAAKTAAVLFCIAADSWVSLPLLPS